MGQHWTDDDETKLADAISRHVINEKRQINSLLSFAIDSLIKTESACPGALDAIAENLYDAGNWYVRCGDELFARARQLRGALGASGPTERPNPGPEI